MEVKRILKPNGLLILSVPNIAALHRRLLLLAGKSPLQSAETKFKKEAAHGHGHLHEYTLKELEALVSKCDFRILNKGWVGPKIADSLRYRKQDFKSRFVRLVYHAVQQLWPAWKNVVWVTATKNE